jgi:hypothetical protein
MSTLTKEVRAQGILVHVTEKERATINENAKKHARGNRSDMLREFGLKPKCPHCGKFRHI